VQFYVVVEMWRRREAWFALSEEKRESILEAAMRRVGHWKDQGVELVQLAQLRWNSRWEAMAIWRIPRIEFLELFAESSHAEAWDVYFEHSSLVGSPLTLKEYCAAI
jgi:hypothetical protein